MLRTLSSMTALRSHPSLSAWRVTWPARRSGSWRRQSTCTIALVESDTNTNRSGTPASIHVWKASRAMRRRTAARVRGPPDSAIQTVIGSPSSGQRFRVVGPSTPLDRYVRESVHALAALLVVHGALRRQWRMVVALRAERCSLKSVGGA